MRRIDTPEQAEEELRRLQLRTADDLRGDAALTDDWARAAGLRASAAELERRAGRPRLRLVTGEPTKPPTPTSAA